MRTGAMVLATAGLVLLAGCGRDDAGLEEQDDQTPYQELAVAADTSDAFEDSMAVPVVPVQGEGGPTGVGGALTATGNLVGVAEGDPPGSVTVTEAPGGTTVLLDITRYTEGTDLAASLVRGSCDEAGSTVTRIGEPFRIRSGGIGRLNATIDAATRQILDGRHSIRVHTPDSDAPEMVLACADLPALDR